MAHYISWLFSRKLRLLAESALSFQSSQTPAGEALPPGGAGVKGTSVKIQGFKSWTSRKPLPLPRSDGSPPLRFAERRYCG